ncbi:hypothetical protein [Lysobacter sp. CA199]|uniref:hypothetical protein n=1 Tax=Lysobacter sp. CA199 TaxID=3455608 RepID=UPI003F8D6BC2
MLSIQPSRRGSEQAELRSVKLRGFGGDALSARQRLERALAGANWKPGELPADAQLFLRRLSIASLGDHRVAERVDQRVGELARGARRPWLDPGAAEAEAIWFGAGELAACLIRDWLQGRPSRPWWWHAALGAATLQEWLRAQVLCHGASLVATTALIAEHGLGPAWMRRMSADDLKLSLATLAADYAAPLADRFDAPDPERPQFERDHTHLRKEGSHARRARERTYASDTARAASAQIGTGKDPATNARRRLLAQVPELLGARLTPAATRLLAYALIARRDPQWLRTPQLAAAIADWAAADDSSDLQYLPSSHESASVAPLSAARTIADSEQRVEDGALATGEYPRPPPLPTSNPPQIQALAAYEQVASLSSSHPGEQADVEDPAHPAPVDEVRAEIRCDAVAAQIAPMPSPVAAAPRHAITETQSEVASEFGGLFYLLNIALTLGLYADFTAPRAANLPLSPWDWLLWIGNDWFGAELRADPIAPLLAALAGHADTDTDTVGPDFRAPHDWCIADHWLGGWSRTDRLHYRAGRQRLCVWHPQGFVLADLARDRDIAPLAQATAWSERYPDIRGARLQRLHRDPLVLPRARSRRWLCCLQLYLRTRLAHALGMDAQGSAAIDRVCRQHARVRCDLQYVHAYFSLDTLPLPLRLAGLDRDPGWVPAAGRDIRFHYD